jgi:serine protease Do
MIRPVKARELLRGAFVGCVVVGWAGSALAQATPPSPFRGPDPSANVPVVVDPAVPPEFADGAPPGKLDTKAAELADSKEPPLERAKKQIVVLTRAGKAIGLGTVLAGDGRLLTALSPLGHGTGVEARFADGTTSRVRVVESSRAWDLALLAADARRSDPGLRASRANASDKGAKLSAFTPGPKTVAPVVVRVKDTAILVGGDDARLPGALVLASKHKPSELGSPVIDERGDVIALLAQACSTPADKPCVLAPYAVPVAAIKDFLRGVRAASPRPPPPFGLRLEAHDAGTVKGVRVVHVSLRSPLGRSGLRAGKDVIVAVDGAPVTTPEALMDALRARRGRPAKLLVFGNGRYREVHAGPRARPNRGFRRVDPWQRNPRRRPGRRRAEPRY